ncbi:hypothetical protein AX15_001485 [Amanita polypyramis BW_CC]|nr:hypothetical protein AX15_001485 [Amanita polypyramis BW_CC]
MVRKSKLAALGPSKLSQVLAKLNAQPKLTLNSLKCLTLSYAFRNDHFGARHFVKDHLPRIRHANPMLDVRVEKVRKTSQEAWRPEIEVEFTNGTVRSIDMHNKWSSAILKELMDLAGDDTWAQWKSQARASGQPIVPGEENEGCLTQKQSPADGVLPTLRAFRASQNTTSSQLSGKQMAKGPAPPLPSASTASKEATPS